MADFRRGVTNVTRGWCIPNPPLMKPPRLGILLGLKKIYCVMILGRWRLDFDPSYLWFLADRVHLHRRAFLP